MKTDDLIRGLAADPRPGGSLGGGFALALLAGLAGACVLFTLLMGIRAGLLGLLGDWRVLLKFALTGSLALAAGVLALRLARPGAPTVSAARALLVPAALLALGVLAELVTLAPAAWRPALVGHYAAYCVTLIPVLAAPFLGALLLALRRGAPTRPTLAGAVAGLLAGGLGAMLYAFHCIDDSPLFVLAWYGIAIAVTTAVGALIGRRVLAW